jgi:MFS transporter, DHA1 family, multidrug resistance protein
MKKAFNHFHLVILLAVLASVAPMGIDTYIPAIPDISKYFEVSIEKIELSLSIFLIGFSIGQIFGGPISDWYGRKLSSIFGLMGFAFFSFLIIFSFTVYELWIYRFFEAFCGGIVVVNAAASVRDKFHGNEAAKVFSLMGTVRSVAPLIAPAIGAFIIHFFPWKAVFVFLTLYALVTALFVHKKLEESFVRTRQNVLVSFKIVLTHKMALKAMLTLALSFSGFFILISKSSYIFIEHFHVSTDAFPFYFGFNFIVLMVMTRVNVFFLKSSNPLILIKTALFIQILAGIGLTLIYEQVTLIQMTIIMATYMSMMAFIFGNSMALALEHFSKNAGVASSVTGVLQFGLGAIISSIALSFPSSTFFPIGLSITVLSFLALLIIKTYKD